MARKLIFNKSEIFFSKNIFIEDKTDLVDRLGVTMCLGTGKYLCLPSMIGRNKKAIIKFIKDMVWNIINYLGWMLFI